MELHGTETGRFVATHARCQCEHISHEDCTRLTPKGNTGHAYGLRVPIGEIVTVSTAYGTFQVCFDCARDCHHGA